MMRTRIVEAVLEGHWTVRDRGDLTGHWPVREEATCKGECDQ